MPFTLEIGTRPPTSPSPAPMAKPTASQTSPPRPSSSSASPATTAPTSWATKSREKTFVEKYPPRGVAYVAINSNETKDHPNDDFAHMKQRAAAPGLHLALPARRNPGHRQSLRRHQDAALFPLRPDRTLRYVGRMDNSPRDATLAKTTNSPTPSKTFSPTARRVPATEAIGCTVKWWGKDGHFIPNDVCDLV